MNTHVFRYAAAAALTLAGATALPAQVVASATPTTPPAVSPAAKDSGADSAAAAKATADKAAAEAAAKAKAAAMLLPPIEVQHYRPIDQRGINVFEPPKGDTIPFTGFKLAWGAAFTQQFQALSHKNTAQPVLVAGATPTAPKVNANQLIDIGNGFNNATANLYMNAQLAQGIRVQLTTYLSARHHQEAWVKDGYLLVDASPIDVPALNELMKYLTLRVGHFELDYGDAHYRRTDNGNAMYNPLVGNYIMDAFTTEIGAEAYVRAAGFLAMAGVTGGEVHGAVTTPSKRSPAIHAKLGFDQQLNQDLRVRMTGSIYQTAKSASNTLYTGDRAGSRYYDVMENTASTETANAWSGNLRTGLGLSSKVRAIVFNPFIKYRGLEFFGNVEQAQGRSATETVDRKFTQNVGELTYRFLNDKMYVAGRYNTVKGRLAGTTSDVRIDRSQVGGGWFVTPAVLAKVEYVNQQYKDYPVTSIYNGGQFKGFMIEGVVGF
jgi:hypothetical protein